MVKKINIKNLKAISNDFGLYNEKSFLKNIKKCFKNSPPSNRKSDLEPQNVANFCLILLFAYIFWKFLLQALFTIR
jgi:hypothetical protein